MGFAGKQGKMFEPLKLTCLGGNGMTGLFNYQSKDNPDIITSNGYLYVEGKLASTMTVRAGDWWLVNFTRTDTAGVYVVARVARKGEVSDDVKLVLRKADR